MKAEDTRERHLSARLRVVCGDADCGPCRFWRYQDGEMQCELFGVALASRERLNLRCAACLASEATRQAKTARKEIKHG
jgi:hypothetical protein